MRTVLSALASFLALTVVLATPVASAKKKPKERYHLRIDQVRPAEGMPAAVADTAKALLLEIIAKRPEFVMTLDGAPDPATDAPGYNAYLKKNKIRAFSVELKLTTYAKTLTPLPEEKKGQLFTVKVALEILGSSLPDTSWAMTGDGSATIAAEIGRKLSPKIEENVTREALVGALTQAVDRALYKLQTQKPTQPKKK